jgi:two-component sensor histidine kinase
VRDAQGGRSFSGEEPRRRMSKVAPSHPVRPGIGLIVRELVINALKHPFPGDQNDGTVAVTYELAEPNWRLMV